CKQCKECFTQSSSLKYHMLIHTGLKPFQSCHLKDHMLVHSGVKPFQYKQCDKCFTQS
uniref:Zinc finger protein 22-like n=1 Tax=Saccoglossus kowalevskii TaxID=10224 RepID=A0ABM0MGJ6_SACKO